MPLSGVGGSPFAVDPQLSGNQATVFWRADVLPTVVPLAPAPMSFAGARPIDFGELGDVKERAGPDGRHAIIRTDSGARIVHLRSDLGPPPLALTRQRHDRLMLMLRALDGHLADASYRDILRARHDH